LRILDVYGVLELFLAADPDHDLYNIEDLFLLLIFPFLWIWEYRQLQVT